MKPLFLDDLLDSESFAIGVDVGGTKTRAVAFSAHGVLGAMKVPTERGPDGVVATVRQVVTALRGPEAGMLTGVLRAVGVGIPGVVDSQAGTVSHGVNVGILGENVPLGKRLAAELNIPVTLVNDTDAATLGAARTTGSGDDVALLSVGTGLAAGFILDGVPRKGASGSAGEIGHMVYRENGLPCACGQRGCLEVYASGRALDRLWPGAQSGHSGEELFAAADSGAPKAVEARDQWIRALAHAVTMTALSVDPAAIVLGGGVSELGPQLLEYLRAELTARASHSPFLEHANVAGRISLVPPGAEIAALGACLAALRPHNIQAH